MSHIVFPPLMSGSNSRWLQWPLYVHTNMVPAIKVPISQGLVTLLHISTVIRTPQSPISPETPCHTVPIVYIAVPSTIITALIANVATSSEDIAASSEDIDKSSADIVTSSADIVTFKG